MIRTLALLLCLSACDTMDYVGTYWISNEHHAEKPTGCQLATGPNTFVYGSWVKRQHLQADGSYRETMDCVPL